MKKPNEIPGGYSATVSFNLGQNRELKNVLVEGLQWGDDVIHLGSSYGSPRRAASLGNEFSVSIPINSELSSPSRGQSVRALLNWYQAVCQGSPFITSNGLDGSSQNLRSSLSIQFLKGNSTLFRIEAARSFPKGISLEDLHLAGNARLKVTFAFDSLQKGGSKA